MSGITVFLQTFRDLGYIETRRKFAAVLGMDELPVLHSRKAKQYDIQFTMNSTCGANYVSVAMLAHLLTPNPVIYPVSRSIQEPADISALAIFDVVSDHSPIWTSSDDGFCSRYSGALGVIFSVETEDNNSLSTDVATFLFTIQQQLRSNDLGPSVIALAYTFRLSKAHGIALFQGEFNGWCDRLRSCGSVGIFGGNQIPYITWPLLDDDLAEEVQLALDIARVLDVL